MRDCLTGERAGEQAGLSAGLANKRQAGGHPGVSTGLDSWLVGGGVQGLFAAPPKNGAPAPLLPSKPAFKKKGSIKRTIRGLIEPLLNNKLHCYYCRGLPKFQTFPFLMIVTRPTSNNSQLEPVE